VLMHACSHSQMVNAKIVELLLSLVDDLNVKNAYGQTALMLAASSGNAEAVRLLVQFGADVNAVSDQQETALDVRCCLGAPDVIEILLQANVDVNWTDDHGWTPLKYALHEKRWDIANLLHDQGAGLAPLTNGAVKVRKRVATRSNDFHGTSESMATRRMNSHVGRATVTNGL